MTETVATPAPADGAEVPAPQEEALDLETAIPKDVKVDWSAEVTPEDRAFALIDIERSREDMRGKIADGLVGLLAAAVLAAFVSIWINGELTDEMKDLLTIILGPLVTLVGSATGFYFGYGGKTAK